MALKRKYVLFQVSTLEKDVIKGRLLFLNQLFYILHYYVDAISCAVSADLKVVARNRSLDVIVSVSCKVVRYINFITAEIAPTIHEAESILRFLLSIVVQYLNTFCFNNASYV